MRYRIRCRQSVAHVHCTVFLQPRPNETFVNCGTLTVRAGEEFAALLHAFSGAEFMTQEPDDIVDMVAQSMCPSTGDTDER